MGVKEKKCFVLLKHVYGFCVSWVARLELFIAYIHRQKDRDAHTCAHSQTHTHTQMRKASCDVAMFISCETSV